MKPYCWKWNNDPLIVCTVIPLSWLDISSKQKKHWLRVIKYFRIYPIDIPMFNSLKGMLHVSKYHAALGVTALMKWMKKSLQGLRGNVKTNSVFLCALLRSLERHRWPDQGWPQTRLVLHAGTKHRRSAFDRWWLKGPLPHPGPKAQTLAHTSSVFRRASVKLCGAAVGEGTWCQRRVVRFQWVI